MDKYVHINCVKPKKKSRGTWEKIAENYCSW